jgi:hypothetical protein
MTTHNNEQFFSDCACCQKKQQESSFCDLPKRDPLLPLIQNPIGLGVDVTAITKPSLEERFEQLDEVGLELHQSADPGSQPVTNLKVTVKVGDIPPEYIRAVSLPKMIFSPSNAYPVSEKEKSAISLTIGHSVDTAACIYHYAKNGIPDGKIVMSILDVQAGQYCEWVFHDATVWVVDFDSFSFSEHYHSNNDFKCDFSFSKLEIKTGNNL